MKINPKSQVTKIAYSLEEASQMLGVSKGHLRNESVRGKLKLLKSGRRTLITKGEIERYLDNLILKEEIPNLSEGI